MKYFSILYTVFALLLLSGCVAQKVDLDSAEHIEMLQEDRSKLGFETLSDHEIELSLQQALERGIAINLDARVAALEVLAADGQVDLARFNAIPALSISTNFIGRSNRGAASSRSIITGTQSLEPSFSTEQYRDTQDLSLNWNILNILLAVSQTQTAQFQKGIAEERYNKVLQNIQKDIYSAYFRALAAQKTKGDTDNLITEAKNHIEKLKKAERENLLSKDIIYQKKLELEELLASLNTLQNQTSLAIVELKSLLSIPQEMNVILQDSYQIPKADIKLLLVENMVSLEAEALKNRPEVRELILQDNINAQGIREEVIRSFPGAELFLALNRDSNQFLNESSWANFTVSVEQNLTALITYSTRKRQAKNQREIDNSRRRSLILAVMTQVHLARQRLDYFMNLYEMRADISETEEFLSFSSVKKAKAGFIAKESSLLQKIDAHIKNIETYQSLAELQNAYAEMNLTLARDLFRSF